MSHIVRTAIRESHITNTRPIVTPNVRDEYGLTHNPYIVRMRSHARLRNNHGNHPNVIANMILKPVVFYKFYVRLETRQRLRVRPSVVFCAPFRRRNNSKVKWTRNEHVHDANTCIVTSRKTKTSTIFIPYRINIPVVTW